MLDIPHAAPREPSSKNTAAPERYVSWVMTLVAITCIGLCALVVTVEHSAQARERSNPPVLGSLPGFTLRDQTGSDFGTAQLASKVWIANFIFTRCPTICPALTGHMAELRDRTTEIPDLHLVSITVDPDHDTPQILADYGSKHGADPGRWSFLTGPFEQVKQAVEAGFKISMGDARTAADVSAVFHGSHFVLVDQQARIRGYHDVKDADGLAALLAQVRHLADRANMTEH